MPERLDGRQLIEQGYSLVYGDKWPRLQTPDDQLLKQIEKVRIGADSFYAVELITAIERAMEERIERPKQTATRNARNLDIRGKTFERSN